MKNPWRCDECFMIMYEADVLVGENPFLKGDVIYGCPNCQAIDSFTQICDVDGCEDEATCGTPTKEGYRRTCGKHKPEAWHKEREA